MRRFFPSFLKIESELPTSGIYVTTPLADLLEPSSAPRGLGEPDGTVRALTPNAFHVRAAQDASIVVRRWGRDARQRVEALGADVPLFYVIDDDVAAGRTDETLPRGYRRRLNELYEGDFSELLARAHRVCASSDRLAEVLAQRVGHARVELIQPSVLSPPAALDHHQADRLDILFPNTLSHYGDWQAIWPAIGEALVANPQMRLTTYLGRLGGQRRPADVTHLTTRSWAQFRSDLSNERFHIALLPALPTPFNAARSHNKLLECAAWGAVPVVSRNLPFSALVEEHGSGIVCGDDPAEWRYALEMLRDQSVREELAAANTAFARRHGDPQIMRRRWGEMLGLD